MEKRDFLKGNLEIFLIIGFLILYEFLVERVSNTSLHLDTIGYAVFLIGIFIFRKNELKTLMNSHEKIYFTRYELNFGYLSRTFLIMIISIYVMLGNSNDEIVSKFLGIMPNIGFLSAILAFALSLFTNTLVSYGIIFGRVLKIYSFKASLLWLGLIVVIFRGLEMGAVLSFIWSVYSLFLFYKSKDLKMTLLSEAMMTAVGFIIYYLYKSGEELSWILVSMMIAFIVEFVFLNLLYNKFVLKRIIDNSETEM